MHIGVHEAAKRIGRGEVVAIPTDTVYGLAASLQHSEQLYALKRRPQSSPFLILVPDVHAAERFFLTEPETFYELADAFWPGGCTLVLPVDQSLIPRAVRAGLPTAGFRMPDKAEALELLRMTGPLVVTSANHSDERPATTADEVERTFGSEFPVIDGGPCKEGIPSTILVYEEGHWRCMREGAVPLAEVAEVTPL